MGFYFQRFAVLVKLLFFGKLSPNYYFGMQKLRARYPNEKIKRLGCFKNEVILHFDKIFNRKRDAPIYDTLGVIQFNNTIWDLTCQDLIKKKGDPDGVQYEWIGDKLIKVLCYREKLQERKIREHYLFSDKQFIMGEYEFLSFNKTTVAAVRDTLQAKYHIRTGETEANFYIRDKHGSLLYFNDQGCDFSVQYYFPQLKDLDEYLRNFLQKSSFGKTSVVLL
jgi:hypothetical protein